MLRARSRGAHGARLAAVAALAACAVSSGDAGASGPDGATLVRLLGDRAQAAFAPGAPSIGALVRLPSSTPAADVGLTQVAPGIARLRGPPSSLLAFASAHPDLPMEVMPPLHLLLDTATTYVASSIANDSGLDGTGTVVGIADTGIDVTHADFLDASGKTRVAWLLDLSSPPRGEYPDLEQRFGITDGSGNVVDGAVWAAADIDALLASNTVAQLPRDEVGHGTLVSACAAGNGLQGRSVYRGVAPEATLVVARITPAGSEQISNDDLLLGVGFLFDRATALGMPMVANLSLGTDFGPHDGTTAWEQTLASYVGSDHPGRALVAAAGNSGSIAEAPSHQNVHVSSGTSMHVPLLTQGAQDGGVQVWVAMHADANLSVGLDGPDGTWISPVSGGQSGGKNASAYSAAIYNGSSATSSPVPSGSSGAVVVWQGQWPSGTYQIALSGTGTADLYVSGSGDAAGSSVMWANGVREGTVNLPATHPSIIGVGCTINKTAWHSLHGGDLSLTVPILDAAGGMVEDAAPIAPVGGEPCWFSSAGPTLTGVQKPEIMAPGAAIVGAMSHQAVPPVATSIFTDPNCPDATGTGTDPECQQIDAQHAVSFGTSFSSPIVAGAVAILLQHDPSMTQDTVLAALQGGAHALRGPLSFEDQSGVGEVDVLGAVQAADRAANPVAVDPVAAASWLTLGADTFLADGSTPLAVVLELRGAGSGSPLPPADGFDPGRLAVYARVDQQLDTGAVTSLSRRGPGVWTAAVQLPSGLGGSSLTIGATLDGDEVVTPITIPIATDTWNAEYPASAKGGCVVTGAQPRDVAAGIVLAAIVLLRRRSRRR